MKIKTIKNKQFKACFMQTTECEGHKNINKTLFIKTLYWRKSGSTQSQIFRFWME